MSHQAQQPEVGKLASDDAGRDAIHIAVIPVVAAYPLKPGQRIALDDDGLAIASRASVMLPGPKPLGIVDPFLSHGPVQGERFYMFLFPSTITSLRHVWTHPEFPDEEIPGAVSPDMDRLNLMQAIVDNPFDEVAHRAYADWLEEHNEEDSAAVHRRWTPQMQQALAFLHNVADELNITYDDLLDGAKTFQQTGNRLSLGEELPDIAHEYEKIWDSIELVTGKSISQDVKSQGFFRCAC